MNKIDLKEVAIQSTFWLVYASLITLLAIKLINYVQ